MGRRLFDLVLAALALLVCAPILAAACVGVRLASAGPSLYRARRVGRFGHGFTMFKVRTMHVSVAGAGSPVTAAGDPRVFPLGVWLRRTKVDELPQLINVLRGEMSIVGPRPEDPMVVERYYKPLHHETLRVRPGLASPGSLYSYTHGERLLRPGSAEADYAASVLPVKLALDVVYVRHASWRYDLEVIYRTIRILSSARFGRREFPPPPELAEALVLCGAGESRAEVPHGALG